MIVLLQHERERERERERKGGGGGERRGERIITHLLVTV